MADDPPFLDELFKDDGGGQTEPPYVDELFSPEAMKYRGSIWSLFGSKASPVHDFMFSSATKIGNVMDAFGQGAKDDWGARPWLSDETAEYLRKMGVYNEYYEAHRQQAKGFNEAFMRPAAMNAILPEWTYPAMTLAEAPFHALGALTAGAQAAVAKAGEEVGAPGLGRELAAIPEAFPFFGLEMGAAGTRMGVPTRALRKPLDLGEARELGIIGGGEAAWKGVAEPKPEEVPPPALAAVLKPASGEPEGVREGRIVITPGAPKGIPPTLFHIPEQPAAAAPAPAAATDIHAVARQANPQLFERWDTLLARRDTFQKWAGELDETGAEPKGTALVRERLRQTQTEMTELAPQVQQAYRDAQSKAPEPTEEQGGRPPAPAPVEAGPATPGAPEAAQAQPAAEGTVPAEAPAAEGGTEGPRGGPEPAAEAATQAGAPKVDTSHDVRSGAVASKDPNGPVYIDPRIPELSPTLRDGEGNPANLHKYLTIHETAERKAMAEGMSYDDAHTKVATPAERAAVQADGVSWDGYTKEMDGFLSSIEHEKAENPPPNPHVDPESAIGHHKGENKGPALDDSAHAVPPQFRNTKLETPSGKVDDTGIWFLDGNKPVYENATRKSLDSLFGERAAEFDKYPSLTGANKDGSPVTVWYKPGEEARAKQLIDLFHDPPFKGAVEDQIKYHTQTGLTLGYSTDAVDAYVRKRFGDAAVERAGPAQAVPPEAQPAQETAAKPAINIADDVAQRLMAAGRPEAEARAAAAIVQAYWETRAARFEGRKGTAAEMYEREAPEILGEKEAKLARRAEFGKRKQREPHTLLEFLASKGGLKPNGDVHAILGQSNKFIPGFGALVREKGMTLDQAIQAAKEGGFMHDAGDIAGTESMLYHGDLLDLIDRENRGEKQFRYGEEWRRREPEGPEPEEGAEPQEVEPGPGPGPEPQAGGAEEEPAYSLEETFFQRLRQGRIRIRDSLTNIITLLKNADASTFIHETAHDWLDRMLKDARDPDAPEALRKIADATFKWLGVDSPERVKGSHHERFARGFEAYMLEGRAPSQALAAVFAKFRDWLVSIYQSVKGIEEASGVKIGMNDDIRGVFDRMLAEKPEAVIAPETEQAKTFADQHEGVAETTPPGNARDAANTIRDERDSLAGRNLVEEDQNARLGDVAAGTGRREAGGKEPPSDGTAPGPESAEGGVHPQPGTVGEGGSETPAHGAGVSAAAAEPARPTEPPAGSNERFGRPESASIDKAGNIRLDNLDTPEDVNAVLREAADQNEGFIEARRGQISDKQVLDLADALGMQNTADKLAARAKGEAWSAEWIMAARKLLVQSATYVRDAAAQAVGGDDAAVIAFAKAADRHRMIQEQVSGITAEAGRALRAFRDLAGAKEAREISAIVMEGTGRTLYQLRKLATKAANMETPSQVSKFMRDTARPGLFDWVQAWFINGLLSGPWTHFGYTVAGLASGLFRAVGEAGAAGMVGNLRNIAGLGPEEYARFGEVPHQLYGMMKGSRDGIKASWQAWKANRTVLPPEVERQPTLPGFVGQSIGVHQTIPNPEIGGVTIPIGTVMEAPSRFIASLHSFNWTTFYSQSIAAQAFRTAVKEKLQGDAFTNRIVNLTQSPTDEMVKLASTEAQEGALMTRSPYGSFTGRLSRVTNFGWKLPDIPLGGERSLPLGTLRPLKFIDPFVQVSANIQRVGLVRGTPLALLSQEVRDDLMMKNGGPAFDRAAGKILAGTSFMIAAGGLKAEGLMNDSGPSDPKERQAWQRVYGLPHGLRIGHMSYDMLRLGPLGLQMSVAADLYHVAHMLTSEDAGNVVANLLHAFSSNIIDESSMRGLTDLMRAVDDHDRYGAAWVRNFFSSFLPFSVGLGQIARQVDPYSRQARTVMDAFKAKIPFVSEELFPRRDIWGEPVSNRGWLGTYSERIADDPVDKALYDLHIYPALPQRHLVGQKLTDEQYDEYARIVGRSMRMRIQGIISVPSFNIMSPERRHDLIEGAVKAAHMQAQELMKKQYEEIPIQARDAKVQRLRGEKPATVH